MNPGPDRSRHVTEDRSVRRTWRLLSGAFVVLAAIALVRAIVARDALGWVSAVAVVVAVVAAVAHRRAVVALEARGRSEAESFARLLHGLSRSVSVDAIVGAIVEDLADGTGADHVVVVRRRADGAALEATLVSRRAGVPSSSTVLPLADLDLAERRSSGTARPRSTPRLDDPAGGRADAPVGRPPDAPAGRPPVARRRSDGSRRAATWIRGVLEDFGLPMPPPAGPFRTPQADVVGGAGAIVAARIAERVRAVYGLSHTLAAPLRSDDGVVGAIVLSRRDRMPWDGPARRLLEGAAIEAAAALARAYTYREAAANASTDPLTGLPNRRYFDEFCGLLARRRRAGDEVAVLMVDIDRFKVLNDTYGHPVGDAVLRAVAGAIVAAVRDEDVPARVGGEEFAVLLRSPGAGVAVEIGERVREAVRALDLAEHGVPGVSVSVGVAAGGPVDEPIPALVARADRALLEAKRTGRDRVIAA